MSERVCKQCGKSLEYRRSHAIFCCKECDKLYRKAQRRAHISKKICVVCGKSFEPHSPRHVCCSFECSMARREAKRKNRRKEYHKEYYKRRKEQKAPKICVVCGASFVPEYNNSICCSAVCSKERNIEKDKARKQANQSGLGAEGQGFLKDCIVCGKTFFSNQPSSLMCSDACRRIRKQQQYAMDMMQVSQQEEPEAGTEMPSWEYAPSYMTATYDGFG